MADDKRKILFDAVSKDFDVGTFDEFNKKLDDPAKQKALYDAVGVKYDLGTFDEFSNKVKKKDISQPQSGDFSIGDPLQYLEKVATSNTPRSQSSGGSGKAENKANPVVGETDLGVNNILSQADPAKLPINEQGFLEFPIPHPDQPKDNRVKVNTPFENQEQLKNISTLPEQNKKKSAYDYSLSGDYEMSNQVLNSVNDDKDGYVYELRADNQKRAKDYSGAKQNLTQAIDLNPKNTRLYAELATVSHMDGDAKTANESADIYLKRTGGEANGKTDVAGNLANVYAIKGDKQKSDYWSMAHNDLSAADKQEWGLTYNNIIEHAINVVKTPPEMIYSGVKEIGDSGGSVPRILGGVMDIGFGAVMATPAGLEFNAAIEAGNYVGANAVTELMFAPVSKLLSGLGMDESKLGNWGKFGVKVGNVLPFMIFAGAKSGKFSKEESESIDNTAKKLMNHEPQDKTDIENTQKVMTTITPEVGEMGVGMIDNYGKIQELRKKIQEHVKKSTEPAYAVLSPKGDEIVKNADGVVTKINQLKEQGVKPDDIQVEISNDIEGAKKVNEQLNQGGQDAVPIEKATAVDVRQQTGNGETMGGGNTQPEGVTGKEEVKKEEVQVPIEPSAGISNIELRDNSSPVGKQVEIIRKNTDGSTEVIGKIDGTDNTEVSGFNKLQIEKKLLSELVSDIESGKEVSQDRIDYFGSDKSELNKEYGYPVSLKKALESTKKQPQPAEGESANVKPEIPITDGKKTNEEGQGRQVLNPSEPAGEVKAEPAGNTKGKTIEPNQTVKTDVETVAKELGLEPIDVEIYNTVKDLPVEQREDAIYKYFEDNYNRDEEYIKSLETQIDRRDSKFEEMDRQIDAINEDEGLSAKSKKTKIANINKRYKELDKVQKDDEANLKLEKDKKEEDYGAKNRKYMELDDINSIVDRINARLETRKGVAEGTDLFPEMANIHEFKAIHDEIKSEVSDGTIKRITEQDPAKLESTVKDIESKAASESETDLTDAIKKADELTKNDVKEPIKKSGVDDLTKKEIAKQKMMDAAASILDKWSNKKNIMPEEKTELWDDLKKFASGLAEYSAQEIMDFIRETFKDTFDRLGMTDKERAEAINESVKDRIQGDKSLKKAVVEKNVEEQFGTEALQTLNDKLQDTDVKKIYEKAKARADKSKDNGLAEAKVVRKRVDKLHTGSADDAAVLLHSMAVMDDMKMRLNDEIRDLPDGKEKTDKQNELYEINNDSELNYLASRKCGREASNVMRLYQGYLDNKNSFTYLEREYKNTKGLKDLTPEQSEEVRKAYDEKKKTREIEKAEEEKIRQKNLKEDNESKFQEEKNNSGKKKLLTQEEKTAKIDRAKALAGNLAEVLASRAGIIKMLDEAGKPDVKKELRELAGIVSDLVVDEIRNKAKSLGEAIDRVFKQFGGSVDKQFINDAFSGELTKGERKTKGALEQKISDFKKEAGLITKLDNLEKYGLPEKQTPADKKANAKIEALRKKVKEKEDELKAPEREKKLSEKEKAQEEKRIQREKEKEARMTEREKERAKQKIENEKIRKQKVIDALKKEILDLQKGIDTRKYKAESKVDPEVKRLREKRDKAKKELGISDAEWNKREISRLNKLTEQTNADIKSGNFVKPQKAQRERYITPELEKARADKANADFKWDIERYKDMMGKRPDFEKFVDKAIKIRTGLGLLSGIKTLGKLLNFTAIEIAYKEPTDVVLSGITNVLFNKMAKKSMIQGHVDLSGRGSAMSTSFLSSKTYKDAASYLTSNPHTHELYSRSKPGAEIAEFELNLTASLVGKKFKIPSGGTLHGAEKYPLWKYTFDKTANRLLKYHALRGADISDKGLLKLIDAQSADMANRRIMMNKNWITGTLRNVQNHLYSNYGVTGKVAYYTTKVLFPIITVPTNFAVKMTRSTAGLFEFAVRASKGVEKMTPQECDMALLAFKEGLQGTGMAISLALLTNSVTYDEKTHKLKILGWEIPNWLAHHPDIAVMKLFAEAKNEFNKKNGTLLTAIESIPLNILQELPFIDDRTMGLVDSPSKFNRFMTNMIISFVQPQMMKDIASWTDKDYSDRQAKTFWERFLMGVPGLSKYVPLKKSKYGYKGNVK